MTAFEAYNDTKAVQFHDSHSAQIHADLHGMQVREITLPDPIADWEVAERLENDIMFGAQLIFEFLTDNRKDPNVTTAQSLNLLQRFAPVKDLAQLGDIKKVYGLVLSMPTDTIFSEARKAKYVGMIETHLNIFPQP